MIHTLKHAYGIDEVIQDIQQTLYMNLIAKWDTDELDAYGRIYKKRQDDGEVIPEVYDVEQSGYKSTYFNGRSCFFFVDANKQSGNGYDFTSELTIVFMIKLDEVYADELERVDEKVFSDVVRLLRHSFEGVFTIESHLKELKNVFKDFGTTTIEDNDTQPYHVFSIKGTLEYFINDNCE